MLQLSEFGLVEITRQRTRRSLEGQLTQPCAVCAGAGRLKSPETIFFEIQREVRKLGPLGEGARILASVHPDVALSLESRRRDLEAPSATTPPARIELVADPALRHGQFSLTVKEA